MMPDQNPIYDFMKSNKLTDLDEKTFLNKYSAPEKAKEVHSFFVENNLTDLDSAKFYDKYLKKKEQLTPSVSSSTKSQSVLPDFEKGRAFAEKGFLMQGEGTKKQQKISFEPSLSMATPFEVKVLEEGEEPSFASDLVTAGARGQIQGKVANLLPAGKVPTNEELGEIAQLQTDAKLLPQSKAEKAYQEKGLKGLFYENPLLGAQFVGETMLSSLASLAEASTRTLPTAIAAGAGAGAAFGGIGALPGAAIGMLAGQSAAGYNLSTSQDILNSLSENGVDISNKESLINAFADENKMAKIRTTAAKYGVPILLFDAATAGLAGKLATGAMGKSLSRKLLAGLGEAGIQMTGGAGGELAGQIASGKKINWDDVAVEAIAEVPGGVTEVATGVALERSKTSSNNNTLATQIATQGPEDGTKDAILNLNRDLANNVITPEQHQEGMDFVEKAVQVSNKIPETVTGESKAKSIELLVERNNIKENNQILEQQKQSADEAYHAGIDEEIKANEEKIKKIDSEVYNIAKNPIPVKEKPVLQISEPTEEIPVVEEYDLKNGDIITANIGGKKEKGRVTGVGRNKGEIVIDFIDENNNERFVYGNQIENIEKGQAEIDNLSKAQKERKAELLNKEELTQDDLAELDKLNKAKAEVKQIESAKPNLEDEYNSKTVDELIALKKKLYPNPDIESPMTPEEKLLDKVIAKKFSEKNQEIIAKRKAAAEEVKPTEVKDGFDYIRNKFIEDVSGGKRLSDKESNILNKEVDKLIERAEKENGVKRNELKQSTWKTNDGYTVTEFFENGRGGTRITTPKGEEINIFDNKYKGESGKDISYFPKASEVKPTEVKTKEVGTPQVKPISEFKVGDKFVFATDRDGSEHTIVSIDKNGIVEFKSKGSKEVSSASEIQRLGNDLALLKSDWDKGIRPNKSEFEGSRFKSKVKPTKEQIDNLTKELLRVNYMDADLEAKSKGTPGKVGYVKSAEDSYREIAKRYLENDLDIVEVVDEFHGGKDRLQKIINGKSKATEVKTKEEPKPKVKEKEPKEIKEEKGLSMKGIRASETRRINQEANKIEISDARSAALKYLSGANLSEQAINEVAGRVKRATLNTGERELKSEEVKSRDYVAKKGEGESLDAAADSIWNNLSDEMQSKMDTQDVKNALMQAISEYKTKAEAAKALIEGYKEESLEDQELEFYRRYSLTEDEIEAELALAEESLELDGSDEYDFDLPEEHINNLIEQYEAEAKNKIEQPTEGGKEKGAEKASAREVGEAEAKLAEEFKEAVKKASKKARENAKNEFVNRNFNLIKEKLKIEIKCPT